jgi:DNA-binding protein H-NS
MSDSALDAIDKEIAALQEKRKGVYEKDRAAALKTALEAVNKFSFTAEELGITGSVAKKTTTSKTTTSTSKAEPKYRDPETGKTWAGGKGPKPKFIQVALAAGKSIDAFLIKK